MKPFERRRKRTPEAIAAAIAFGAGLAVVGGLVAWWVYRRGARGHVGEELEQRLVRAEEDVVERLQADERLSGQPIEVAALATGIIELSGAVETRRDAELAVSLARRAGDVRTVLNRLDVLEEMDRVEQARQEEMGPGTARGETRWLGVGVGMGRRRQGRQTDPGRRDDRADIVTGELGVDRAVEQTSEPLDKIPNATEHSASASQSAPDDYGTISDTSHRRTGNAQPSLQDTGSATHENVPPGTEVTLERSGLEGELEHRHQQEQG